MKALDVQLFDVREKTSITDHMFVATGTSSRQVKAIGQHLVEEAKAKGHTILGVEGLVEGQWVLVDLGDAIVHVMHPDSRSYYQLEKLWSVEPKNRNTLAWQS